MTRRGTEIQVGLALVVALFVLVFGLMWFQDYQIGASYERVSVVFAKVGGLGPGDPVEVRGLDLGKVTSIDIIDGGVLVTLRLPDAVVLREDAVIRLGSAGIMGERIVAIEPGTGDPIDISQHVFQGQYEAASTELVGTFEVLNERLMQFLDTTEVLLNSLHEDQVLVRTLENTARAAGLAADVLQENRTELKRASTNMADLAGRMTAFLDQYQDDMGEGVRGLTRATVTMDSLARRMNTVLDGTDDILTALQEQRGPAGRMIYDEQAGEDLVESLKQLRFLVEDLQRNPQRYLTVEIF